MKTPTNKDKSGRHEVSENLQKRIVKARKDLDKLISQQKRNDAKKRKRWSGKFVNENREGAFINPKPTELGIKELRKYSIEYFDNAIPESGQVFWENKNISYTPKKCFCMVCGDLHTVAWIQFGIAPRFATCAKHADFIHLGFHLQKKEQND